MKIPSWWPTAALVVAVIIGWRWYGNEQQRQGELRQRIAAREAVIKELAKQAAATDTVYQSDTLRFTSWKTRYVSARDTLVLTDTVQVKEVLSTADSTIKSCSAALVTCEQRVAQRDTLIKNLGEMLRDVKKVKVSRFGCVAGGVVSDRGIRPGVGCGIRF